MSFAPNPTPTLGTRDAGVLPGLLFTLVLAVVLLGMATHALALLVHP